MWQGAVSLSHTHTHAAVAHHMPASSARLSSPSFTEGDREEPVSLAQHGGGGKTPQDTP